MTMYDPYIPRNTETTTANLPTGLFQVEGQFDGERWDVTPNSFSFLDQVEPKLAALLVEYLRDRYRGCQHGSLSSTTPISTEFRFHVLLSGTIRWEHPDGSLRFSASNTDKYCLPWDDLKSDQTTHPRQEVCIFGPGIYLLPIGSALPAINDSDSTICENSVADCGSAGCYFRIKTPTQTFDGLGGEPYSTYIDGRWFINVPYSGQSVDRGVYEIIDGKLPGND